MIKIYSRHIIFKDIVNCVYNSIKNLNYKVKITDKIDDNNDLYILIGVVEFIDKIPNRYIIFQFEQTNVFFNDKKDIWFTKKYIELLNNAIYIWDYSNDNIKYLIKNLNIGKPETIFYIPLKYSNCLDNLKKITENKKDIDILFMGSINERRKKILDRLEKKYITHTAPNNLWNEERDNLVSRSKIILNIQFYDNGLLEMVRLSYLLSGGAFIISEIGREEDIAEEMKHFLILGKYSSLELLINKYLENSEERIKKKKQLIENWKKTNMDNSIPLKCLENEETGIIKNKGKIDYYIPKNIESIEYNVSEEGYCILKLPNILDEYLPNVSIITPTKNRKIFFRLAITNFNNYIYPQEKLEWIIVDNGNEDLEDILPKDYRIKYIKVDNREDYSIGFMRNKCIENCSNDIICYMDDDDVYRPESILARVKSLIKYKSEGIECVGCTQVGCFNIINGQSVLGSNNLMYLSEASMTHTKKFWIDRNYDNSDYYGEFKYFLLYRQSKIKSIPYQFIMTALNHKTNSTGNLRHFKNYNEWIEKNSNDKNFSFFDLFENNIKSIIKSIIKNL